MKAVRELKGLSVMGSLEPGKIESIARALFPGSSGSRAVPPSPFPGIGSDGATNVLEFSAVEVADAVSRYKSRDRAPSPDGITSLIWGVVHDTRPAIVEFARLQRMLEDRNLPRALETR